ncbi:unnamed protein product, partial [marine sediment metagenome]
ELWLLYLADGEWHDCKKEELATGSWLFSGVPPNQEAYRVYGESPGFLDPELPEHQNMTEDELRIYHYHRLIILGEPRQINFYAGVWYANCRFQCLAPAYGIHVRSELNTKDFTGDLRIGIKRYTYPVPEVWLAPYHTHSVNAADPDPKHYYDTFTGLSLKWGMSYFITLQLINGHYIGWNGKLYYWLLS